MSDLENPCRHQERSYSPEQLQSGWSLAVSQEDHALQSEALAAKVFYQEINSGWPPCIIQEIMRCGLHGRVLRVL